MKNSWEIILEAGENGEVILPFPPELIEQLGWLEGDELDFDVKPNGYAIIVNITKSRDRENGFD